MVITRGQTPLILSLSFSLALLLQTGLFWFLPEPIPIVLGLFVMVLGCCSFGVSLVSFIKMRRLPTLCAVVITVLTAIVWRYFPIEQFGIVVKFKANQSMYRESVLQYENGNPLKCSLAKTCLLSTNGAKYLVFPWEGLLSAWKGVVYVPNGKIDEFVSNIDKSGLAGGGGCNHAAISDNFFICTFY